MTVDILLLTIPKVTFTQVQAACPILKGVLVEHGYSCEIYDCNIEFYKTFKDSGNAEYLSDYFLVSCVNEYTEEELALINAEVDRWVDHIKQVDPEYLGISLFSYESQKTAKMICERLADSDIKIILGGSGVGSAGRVGKSQYAEDLYTQELIHAYVTGDGEAAILEIVQGKKTDNINSIQYTTMIDINYYSKFLPNYDDIEFDEYAGHTTIPITGSKGCVRQCTFCTEGRNAFGFRYRTGQSIAEEMIYQSSKHKINSFYFTDSLINGSMKAYTEFTDIMSAENKSRENYRKLNWGGYFICRPRRAMPEYVWENSRLAGANLFNIGIESGSERIRNHMMKKFSNDDMDYTIEQMSKNNIKLIMLMVIGYPYETREDFEESLDLFRRWKKYSDNGTIYEVNVGSTCQIFPDTPLYLDPNIMYADKYNSRNPMGWINIENPELNMYERERRYTEACKLLTELGYPFRAVTEAPEDWSSVMTSYAEYVNEHEQEVIRTQQPFYRDL